MPDVQLLIIDPQNDFCEPRGALAVPGAGADMDRLGDVLNRIGSQVSAIHVTLDSHHFVDIAHPVFWRNRQGGHPAPFTIISHQSVRDGLWLTTSAEQQAWALEYTAALAANHRYDLCIWPPHCLIGSWGAQVHAGLYGSLGLWETSQEKSVNYVLKGGNPLTEHYSAIQADVKLSDDPGTSVNRGLLDRLSAADLVLVAGEAMSHCVRFSTLDLLDQLPAQASKKIVILEDAMSSVGGFESAGREFLETARGRGVRVDRCGQFSL